MTLGLSKEWKKQKFYRLDHHCLHFMAIKWVYTCQFQTHVGDIVPLYRHYILVQRFVYTPLIGVDPISSP
jgi:hypothetical protein